MTKGLLFAVTAVALSLGVQLGSEQYDDHGDPHPNHEADHRA